jgi:hypothetical protein
MSRRTVGRPASVAIIKADAPFYEASFNATLIEVGYAIRRTDRDLEW